MLMYYIIFDIIFDNMWGIPYPPTPKAYPPAPVFGAPPVLICALSQWYRMTFEKVLTFKFIFILSLCLVGWVRYHYNIIQRYRAKFGLTSSSYLDII